MIFFGTSKEGQEFLKAQGVTQTDDDAKTRAQKEKLEEITTPEDPPKLARDSTMAVTAKVWYIFIWSFLCNTTALRYIQLKDILFYNRKVLLY